MLCLPQFSRPKGFEQDRHINFSGCSLKALVRQFYKQIACLCSCDFPLFFYHFHIKVVMASAIQCSQRGVPNISKRKL